LGEGDQQEKRGERERMLGVNMIKVHLCIYENSINKSIRIVKKPSAMAHYCNPSYLGVRDWEDHGSRPAWAKTW
jgi:hypothetical protein